MAAYAKWIVNQVLEPGLDGVDVDWEGWSGSDLVRLIKELGKYFGPEGEQPDKLLIVDYFSGNHQQTSYLIVIISFNRLIVIKWGS